MGSAKSNIVQVIFSGLGIIPGTSGERQGYVGAGNPLYPAVGALIPTDGAVVGYPLNAVFYLDSSGDEEFIIALTGAPSNVVWSVSFTDDNDTVWTFATDTPGVVYTSQSGTGFWVFGLAGPDYPAFTDGVLYPLTITAA